MHIRTWDGPPGICVPDVSRSVWMESTASRNGRASRAVSSTCARSRPGANAMASPDTPSRRARAATCACDSSPDTSTHVCPVTREMGEHVEQQRGLADAGLAREERHGRRHDAAAEHAIDAGGARGDAPLIAGRGGQRAERVHAAGARCRSAGGADLVDRPPLPAAGTTAHPLRHLLSTRRAREDRPDLRHDRTVPGGSDIACHRPLARLSSLGGCTLHLGNTKARKEG